MAFDQVNRALFPFAKPSLILTYELFDSFLRCTFGLATHAHAVCLHTEPVDEFARYPHPIKKNEQNEVNLIEPDMLNNAIRRGPAEGVREKYTTYI